GVSLAGLIRRERSLTPARAANVIAQIASALDYAHAFGYIHRDVKPSNIMVGAGDHATLTDFGIVKAAEGTQVTKSGMMVGTPEYMAPEQISGKTVDARSDIYALGVVGFEMLAGRAPFHGDTPRVLHAHVYEAPQSLHSINPRVSTAVEQAVGVALAKDSAQRYARAGEFANALSAAVSGVAPQPRAPEPPTRYVARQPRKQSSAMLPVLAGVAGAAVLLLLVLAIAFNASRGSITTALAPTATPTIVPIVVPTTAATTQFPSTAAPTAIATIARAVIAAPTSTPVVNVVTAPPILPTATPTLTGTPTGPQKRLDYYEDKGMVGSANLSGEFQARIFAQTEPANLGKYDYQGINSAVWSSDGKIVLVSAYEFGGSPFCYSALIQIDLSGSKRVIAHLSDRQANDCYSSTIPQVFVDAIWSSDGSKIAVNHMDEGGQNCPFMLNADGSVKRIDQCDSNDYPRYWSVDGKWIVMANRPVKCEAGRCERVFGGFYAFEVNGNRRVPLEQLGKIQMYDERYWPWKVIDSPMCKGASFWECE
ncbi:MAG: serine/threonine-protein kinase, partial [Chloroflexota bacterium]|nr:serine/threonine-protein kinase [Chloroflexota bacterium]